MGRTGNGPQDLIIFPAKGQSQDQMEKDKFDCYTWAKQQTGFDPVATPQEAFVVFEACTGGCE